MFKYLNSRHSYFIVLLFVISALVNAQTSLKDETRLPWATATGDFLRDWLIVGGFPNQDSKGFDTDFLQEHNGELKIKPELGMKHKFSDGSTFVWKNYHSPYNYINFFDILENVEYSTKVGYAFTKVQRPANGKVILSFGHNVSNKIWVNGNLVYESRTDYQAAMEDNHIEVDMVKGENSILIKSVHGGWTWGFTFRVIEPEKFSLIHDFKLSPSIVKSNAKDELIIKTDRTLNPEIQKFDVNVKAVVAGGKVIAERKVKRGEQITFDTKKWPNGVYDVCFKSNNNRGEVVTSYLYWYKGDAIKEAQELFSSIPKNPKTPDDYLHVMLSQLISDKYGDVNKIDSSKLSALYSPLMEYEELKLDKAGKKGSVRENGFVRLRYIDDIDNTPQFCRAYLPLDYDPEKKWPLVINLHGYYGANPVYVKWWSIDQRHTNVVDKYPVINIDPHGRGNTSYNGIGERDVLRCIELAKQFFNVDEDRIYLKGESMGGGGTWNVGTRHPELFAAIAPVFGGWDYHSSISEEQLAKLTDDERFTNEANSSFSHADALLTTPVFVLHGDIDKSVDVKYSRYAVKMLQRWGYDIRYREYPGFGHEGIEYYDELIPWFLKHKRNANPEKVRVRSSDLKSASAHWVKVTQREKPDSFIEAEAEVLLNNTIKLFTQNVLEVELSPSGKLIDPKRQVKIIWNVNDIREARLTDGKILLRAKDYNPSESTKNPKIGGPVSDIATTPFAVVIGTISKDSLMTKIIDTKAQQFISYWKNWQKYEPRVFKDTDLTQDDLEKYSLILYGSADDNLITKILGDKIPLNISSNEIEITGKKFPAKDAYVQMIYPNPFNSERYVSVIGSTSAAGMFLFDGTSQNCDFIIQDGVISTARSGQSKEKYSIATGFFDNDWKINDKLLTVGDSELRKKSPIRKVMPDLTTTIDNLPVVDSIVFKTLAGKYGINAGISINVFVEAGKLMATSPEGMKFQLLPITETEYFIDMAGVQLTFVKNEKSVVESLIVYQRDSITEMKKIE